MKKPKKDRKRKASRKRKSTQPSVNTVNRVAANSAPASPLVTRSSVTPGLKYPEYREPLRYDFFYSCAYCTMTEAEAQSVRFTIDHYEPKILRADLIDEYNNLMYACDECNKRKGSRSPPPSARAAGYRFFRPDNDIFEDHFDLVQKRIKSKTNIGFYTQEALDLNRLALQTIRDIRVRLKQCHEEVASGVLALRTFHIDQLPPGIKGRASSAIRGAENAAKSIVDDIDKILRSHAKSLLLEEDSESGARERERTESLKRLKGLYEGKWHG